MEIENYLINNRLNLDTEKPDDSVWEGVKSDVEKHRRRSGSAMFWKVAAIIIFVLSTTYVIYNESRMNSITYKSVSDVSKELRNQERELQSIVNRKVELVNGYDQETKNQFQFLFDELAYEEQLQKNYLDELGELGANEQIIRSLLEYYDKKIRILDRILNEIEKQQNHEINSQISI